MGNCQCTECIAQREHDHNRDSARRMEARIATIEAQLKAQRAIVAANDVYRSRLVDLRNAQSLDKFTGGDSAIMAAADVDEANRACRQTHEAAEQLDKETPDAPN